MSSPAPLGQGRFPFGRASRRVLSDGFVIHDRALPAFDTLEDEELDAAERVLHAFVHDPASVAPAPRPIGEGAKGEALLLYPTDDLWLIVRRPLGGSGPVEVLDVVRSEFIANFKRGSGSGRDHV